MKEDDRRNYDESGDKRAESEGDIEVVYGDHGAALVVYRVLNVATGDGSCSITSSIQNAL